MSAESIARIRSSSLNGLVEKVDRSCLDRAHGRGNVAVPRDEHDVRVSSPSRSESALQVESVHIRELDVQNETGREVGLGMRHEFGGRAEGQRHACRNFESSGASDSQMRRSSSTIKTMWPCGSAILASYRRSQHRPDPMARVDPSDWSRTLHRMSGGNASARTDLPNT